MKKKLALVKNSVWDENILYFKKMSKIRDNSKILAIRRKKKL